MLIPKITLIGALNNASPAPGMAHSRAIVETSEELTEWERTPAPSQEYGTWYTTKQAIKSFVFGGIIGCVVLFCWFAVKYILSNTVKTENDWKLFGIPVIGRIRKDSGKHRGGRRTTRRD